MTAKSAAAENATAAFTPTKTPAPATTSNAGASPRTSVKAADMGKAPAVGKAIAGAAPAESATSGAANTAATAQSVRSAVPHGAAVVRLPPVGVVSRPSTEILSINDADVAGAVRFIRDHA